MDLCNELVNAAGRGNKAKTKLLLEQGANPNCYKIQILTGKKLGTPLRYALSNSDLDIADLLISYGADIHEDDDELLVAAAKEGNIQAIQYLLNKDVNKSINKALSGVLFKYFQKYMNRNFYIPRVKNLPQILNILLEYGANINSLSKDRKSDYFYLYDHLAKYYPDEVWIEPKFVKAANYQK